MASQTDAATEAIDHHLADAVDTFGVDEKEADAFADFIESALEEANQMLSDNRLDAKAMNMVADGDDPIAEEVLEPENVRDVQWEASRFGGRRVTVWLRDCPSWANTADTRSFKVGDLNDRNRDVTAVIDVRPF